MVLARIPFQTQARAGTVTMLEAVRTSASIRLQIYRSRPRSINPPTAFIDRIDETFTEFVLNARQRIVTVQVIVVHGLSTDWGEAADQRDAFVDGFADWVADTYHGFGSNTLVRTAVALDLPDWVPEWLPEVERRAYYATQIDLEGFAST